MSLSNLGDKSGPMKGCPKLRGMEISEHALLLLLLLLVVLVLLLLRTTWPSVLRIFAVYERTRGLPKEG